MIAFCCMFATRCDKKLTPHILFAITLVILNAQKSSADILHIRHSNSTTGRQATTVSGKRISAQEYGRTPRDAKATSTATAATTRSSNDLGHGDDGNFTKCKCMPDSACWPNVDKWKTLNHTLGGQLVRPKPPAAPCYNGANLNITECQIAAANWANPFWRADQVGAMQYSNKETHGNQSCSLLSSPLISTYGESFALKKFGATMLPASRSVSSSSQCQQGAVPSYAVEVLDASHVQDTVSFAAQHNLRLSIKSTGHDVIGRSTAPGSVNLWMHKMKNITFQERFIPSGCDAKMTYPVVTVQSGTQWSEVYAAAEARNLTVVGAMSASVSTGGGFLQGGGHSPLSPFLGLAADNVVEIEVVTADGRLQIANACQNQDLFWAFRGGGGGTFGVVISSTHITYPRLQNVVNVFLIATSTNATLFEELLTNFIRLQAVLSEENFWAGYAYISLKPLCSLNINYLVPNCNTSTAQQSFQSLLNFTTHYANEIAVDLAINTFPSFGAWHKEVLCSANPGICSDRSGVSTVLASRLLPQKALEWQAPHVAQAFMRILSGGVDQIIGHLVGGLGVAAGQSLSGPERHTLITKLGQNSGDSAMASLTSADKDDVLIGRSAVSPADLRKALRRYAVSSAPNKDSRNATNSVNPAFRAALWHVVLLHAWREGESTLSSQELTQMNGLLRDLSPGSGCYLNEADANEPNWQDAFFGQHYSRLRAIKDEVDPQGLFTCTNCVGSEPWTTGAQSLCRQPANPAT